MSDEIGRHGATCLAALQAPRRQFIKDDGVACGSAALKHQRRCSFHSRNAYGRKRTSGAKPAPFQVPILDNERAIQAVATGICRVLVEKTLDSRRAKTLLYGLQIASSALAESSDSKLVPATTTICLIAGLRYEDVVFQNGIAVRQFLSMYWNLDLDQSFDGLR